LEDVENAGKTLFLIGFLCFSVRRKRGGLMNIGNTCFIAVALQVLHNHIGTCEQKTSFFGLETTMNNNNNNNNNVFFFIRPCEKRLVVFASSIKAQLSLRARNPSNISQETSALH